MDDVPALKKIDVLIDATHTKILKPDPRAYRLALDALHVAPQETLFVDDQRRNVEGAQMLGIEAVHFDIRRPAEMVMELRATLALPTSTA
jgi:putative hydrolase of the HAD superfamily